MLRINVRALDSYENCLNLDAESAEIDGLFSEFFGKIEFTGSIKRQNDKYIVQGKVKCNANLICDLSNEEYTELIESDVKIIYVVSNYLYEQNKNVTLELDEEQYLREDDLYIDITDIVKQELALSLPMKRVSPQYRNKDLADIYPEYTQYEETTENTQWDALKKLNLN